MIQSALVRDLHALIGEARVSTAPAILDAHGRDESYHIPKRPDAVVFADSTEVVATVLRYASSVQVPVTPFTVGSSLEGHVVPVFGGISLDTSLMNAVLELRPEDLLAVCQPGVLYPRLNALARPHGLFMPVDPGAEASIGGMTATNTSGTATVRYGTMRDAVLALEVVLANGEVVRVGSEARKSSSGYDLRSLFVGSEGTLGVFTEVTVRLHGLPQAVSAAVAVFPDVRSAVEAAVALLGAGVPVARVELLDQQALRAVNQYKSLAVLEQPTLFLEFHGNAAAIEADVELAREICEGCGGVSFEEASDPAERTRLWTARHHALWAVRAANPNRTVFSTDAAVPFSKLPEAVGRANDLLATAQLRGGIVGHVGDGNFHVFIAANPDDASEWSRANDVNHAVVQFAIEAGGTATGEHGVGIRKRDFMPLEHGAALNAMRAVKRALDPKGILNPGKLVDEVEAWPLETIK